VDTRLQPRQRLRAIGIGSLCWFLAGCQYDPWAGRFLTNRPAERDVVGTYRVDSDTLTRGVSIPMSSERVSISRDAEIVLSADHRAQYLHVPEIDMSTTKTCVITGTGSWQQGRNDDYVVVNVEIQRKDYRESADPCGPTYHGQLMLYGKSPPYKLHITIGDPDSGDAVQFEKTN
jgi:hypothetical protein